MAKCMDWPLCNGSLIGRCECEAAPKPPESGTLYTLRKIHYGVGMKPLGNFAVISQAKAAAHKDAGDAGLSLWETHEEHGQPRWSAQSLHITYEITVTDWSNKNGRS